ncbi:hypothetical protein LC55x_5564 [Lysobacter capsici]|nr:hypothetical protein LC55x_5564 [Lysobacter capsici]
MGVSCMHADLRRPLLGPRVGVEGYGVWIRWMPVWLRCGVGGESRGRGNVVAT